MTRRPLRSQPPPQPQPLQHHDEEEGEGVSLTSVETIGYWSQYPDFKRDETASLIEQFGQLAVHRKWGKSSKRERREKHSMFVQEFTRNFSSKYQTEGDGNSRTLEGCQALCDLVDIERGDTITQCKKALSGVYVNIIDLIEAQRNGTKPKRFTTQNELMRYTKDNGKTLSKVGVKQDPYLKVFLKRFV